MVERQSRSPCMIIPLNLVESMESSFLRSSWHKFRLPDPWKSLCFSVTPHRNGNLLVHRTRRKSGRANGRNIPRLGITSSELFHSSKHISCSIPCYIIIPLALYSWFRRIFAEIFGVIAFRVTVLGEFNINDNICVYGDLLWKRDCERVEVEKRERRRRGNKREK